MLNLWRTLSTAEEVDFRTWAHENYKPGDAINAAWHPVVQHEAATILLNNWKESNHEILQ